mgnify:CR=1 FL=1
MLGKRLDYQVEENKIHFFFEKEEAFLEVITESIMNVFVPYETKGHRSKAIEGEKAVRTVGYRSSSFRTHNPAYSKIRSCPQVRKTSHPRPFF